MESIEIRVHMLKEITPRPIAVAEFVPERQGLAMWWRGEDGKFSEYPLRPCATLKEARAIVQSIYFRDKVATEANTPRAKSEPRKSRKTQIQADLFQAA